MLKHKYETHQNRIADIISEVIRNHPDNDYLSDFNDVHQEIKHSMMAFEPLGVDENGSAKFSTQQGIDDKDYKQNKDFDDLSFEDRVEERIISAMKGSSTVDVKKRCRLAGKGTTSDACNQGDINNLIIKSIKKNEE